MKRHPLHIIIPSLLLCLAACHGDPPMVVAPTKNGNNLKENMINANKTIAQSEETAIDQYVERRHWNMQTLTNGARVMEYEVGKGPKVNYEDSVHIRYRVEAINGHIIYDSIEEHFVAGRRQQMIGLDEAVRALHFGSRAKVILPSNLAYGMGGDGDRIPQQAVLVLDITIE